MKIEEEYLKPIEAARFIGFRPETLTNWRSRRIGPPYYRRNRRIFYKRRDLIDFMEAGKVETVPCINKAVS
jgi:hypothetical protein